MNCKYTGQIDFQAISTCVMRDYEKHYTQTSTEMRREKNESIIRSKWAGITTVPLALFSVFSCKNVRICPKYKI